MKTLIKSILVIVFLFGMEAISAQSDMNFTLTSESLIFSGQQITIFSTLTKSGDTLTWVQNNTGTPVALSFNITESSGGWDQGTSMGTMDYTIVLEGEIGYINLTGDTNGFALVMTLKGFDNADKQYIFNIDSISYQ